MFLSRSVSRNRVDETNFLLRYETLRYLPRLSHFTKRGRFFDGGLRKGVICGRGGSDQKRDVGEGDTERGGWYVLRNSVCTRDQDGT